AGPLTTIPLPVRATLSPADEAIVPSFTTTHPLPAGPSTASTPCPVAVIVPEAVTESGVSARVRTIGPATLLLMALPCPGARAGVKISTGGAAAALLGPLNLEAARTV